MSSQFKCMMNLIKGFQYNHPGTHIRIHYHFSTSLLTVGQWFPFSYVFFSWLKPLVTALVAGGYRDYRECVPTFTY